MIKSICRDLLGRLVVNGKLPFIDVYSGLVQTVQIKDTNGDGVSTVNRFPVSYNVVGDESCVKSPEKAMIPNSFRKGILYFEESGGISPMRDLSGGRKLYKVNLIMVVWLNRRKITGNDYDNVSTAAFEEIKKKLKEFREGENMIVNISFNKFRQDPNIFSNYTYDETEKQYLRPPFEYFAVDVSINFISLCKPELVTNPNLC